MDPQSKITKNQTLELKVYEDSLADSAGNNLASATNLSIPIVNAESGVINLDENTFAPHSDGQPRVIFGDDSDNYINESSNGSVLVGNSGNDNIETNSGINWLFGGSGNDYLTPGDTGQKYVYGGDGGDVLTLKLNTNFNTFDLSSGNFNGQWNGNWNNDNGSNEQFIQFSEIEHLQIFGGGSGIVRGDQNNNYINANFETYGGSGDDYLTARDNVNIFGEDGNDIIEFRGEMREHIMMVVLVLIH